MTSDKVRLTASMLVERNARKEDVASGNISAGVENAVTYLTAIEEPGIYNLVGRDETKLTETAWRLAKTSQEWMYIPWMSPPKDVDGFKVIVDRVAATRMASRRIREIRTFDSAEIVVAVSQSVLPEINQVIRISEFGSGE